MVGLSIILLEACQQETCPPATGKVCLQGAMYDDTEITSVKRTVTEGPDNLVVKLTSMFGNERTTTYGEVKGTTFEWPRGNASAEAYNQTENEAEQGYGSRRFYGKQDFEVLEKEVANVVLTCTMANAKISIALSETFQQTYDLSATTVTIAENTAFTARTLTMVSGNATSKEAFYTAGRTLSMRLTSKKLGATNSFTVTAENLLTTNAATHHVLTLDYDESKTGGGIIVSADGTDCPDFITLEDYTQGNITEDN